MLPTSAGTGPMHTVFEALEVPMAALAWENANGEIMVAIEMSRLSVYTHELIQGQSEVMNVSIRIRPYSVSLFTQKNRVIKAVRKI